MILSVASLPFDSIFVHWIPNMVLPMCRSFHFENHLNLGILLCPIRPYPKVHARKDGPAPDYPVASSMTIQTWINCSRFYRPNYSKITRKKALINGLIVAMYEWNEWIYSYNCSELVSSNGVISLLRVRTLHKGFFKWYKSFNACFTGPEHFRPSTNNVFLAPSWICDSRDNRIFFPLWVRGFL